MRPPILETGYRPVQKVLLHLFQFVTGGMLPGPMLVLTYRRELFGKYLAGCYQEGMRRAKGWRVSELETFAAFVSRLNACRY